jgi:hypothetical protein
MMLDRYGHLMGDEFEAVAARREAARANFQRNSRGPIAVPRIGRSG